MAIPEFQNFFYTVLKLLSEKETATTKECYDFSFKFYNLNDNDIAETFTSNMDLVAPNRVRWAIMYLKGAELIESLSRGKYKITREGANFIKNNPLGFNNDVIAEITERLNKTYSQRTNTTNDTEPTEVSHILSSPQPIKTPIEIINENTQKINSLLANEVLDALYDVNPYYFEKICVDLLINMGYGYHREGFKKGETTRKSNDFGIDGIIYQDRLGFDRIYVQAKRYQKGHSIGREDIQKFDGAIPHGIKKAIFITTSDFNSNAKECAKSKPHIILVNGNVLSSLMIEYNLGVIAEQTIKIKRFDSEYFEEK